MTKHVAVLALALAAVTACEQSRSITNPQGVLAAQQVQDRSSSDAAGGSAVYALTNQAAGNAVAVFHRAANGTLAAAGSVATGGTGAGTSLGSQGALALTGDGRWLFAVNAGSNDISVFQLSAAGPALASRTPSGGIRPISLTVHGNLLYVLNAGGAGNITGFTVGADGALHAIAGSTRALSGPAVGPAEVAFSPDGRALVVSEKTTNQLDVYPVGDDGTAGTLTAFVSAGGTPFGFSFGLRNLVFVSEAAGSASSYRLDASDKLALVSGAVATHQGAPCWAVVSQDARFGYTADAHTGVISGFTVATDGAIALLDATGATATVGNGNTDLALSADGRYLYNLVGTKIVALQVAPDGHLSRLASVGGLPTGSAGLVAR